MAACSLVQAREPAAGMIVIDIPAVLDRADAINNISGLIEFKRYLGQAVEITVWMRAHYERNLWFGEPDFSSRSHRTNETDQGRLLDFMLLGRFAPRTDYAPNICSSKPWFRKLLPLGSGEARTGDARGRDGGIREELARG